MYQALYRKWRPVTFDDVCGQNHITDILKYQTTENRISHAYLFCGPRGTGKTTCAKILAKAINCLSPVNGNPCGKCAACQSIDHENTTDVLEMDAASNNGVDAVRAIRDEVIYTPSDLKYRVYIVDEVHMLSISAFNALLKTLEEPPAHVVFILATTELQKLPATIISRCQRFDFRRIETAVISDRLSYIAGKEQIMLEPAAARILAKHANGGMRDAISLLDLCSSRGGVLSTEAVRDVLGISSTETVRRLTESVLNADYAYIFSAIRDITASSVDLSVFWQDLISFYRDILVVKTTSAPEAYLDVTDEELAGLKATAALCKNEQIVYHLRLLDEAFAQMQRSGSTKRMIAELTLIRMCDPALSDDSTAMLARLSTLEDKVGRLAFGAPRVVATDSADEKSDAVKKAPEKPEEPVQSAEPVKNPEVSARPLPYWLELTEALSRESRSAMGLQDGSKAYRRADGAITVKFSSAFTMKLMSDTEIKATLAAMISAREGTMIPADRVYYELTDKEEIEKDDFFDTLENE